MTIEYFAPLPPGEELDFDGLLQWLGQQTVSFQKVITGSLQAGQELSSANFVAGSTGWQIDGDGNAEFNDVVIRGDLESGNWNGASPANLATEDATATAGYYLDSSVGSMQLEGDLFLGGDMSVSGDIISNNWDGSTPLSLPDTGASVGFALDGSSGVIQGQKLYLNETDGYMYLEPGTNSGRIGWHLSSIDNDGKMYVGTSNSDGVLSIQAPYDNPGDSPILSIFADQVDWGPSIGLSLTDYVFGSSTRFRGAFGSASLPAYGFVSDSDTGIYRSEANALGVSAGGTLKAAFRSADTRIYGINDTTTGAAANVFINSTSSLMARSTSLRKHKSRIAYNVDYLSKIELKPVKFYRKDDKRWWYGFIAEDLAEADTLLGEYGEDGELAGYDLREVVAVLAAKVNKLEKLGK